MELHVHISHRPDKSQVLIDGLDIVNFVKAKGFKVEMTVAEDGDHRPLVTMQMRATTVTVDGTEVNLNLRPPDGVDPEDPEQVAGWLRSVGDAVTKSVPAGGAS